MKATTPNEIKFLPPPSPLTGAVHQVLFRQRDELASGIEVLSLQGASGTEGPAGSALSLWQHTGGWEWSKTWVVTAWVWLI